MWEQFIETRLKKGEYYRLLFPSGAIEHLPKRRTVVTPEELREQAERLRRFSTWAKDEYVYRCVEIESDEYYIDLGAFGEQTMHVSLENSEYEIDPGEVIDEGGVSTADLDEMADALESAANKLDMATPTLEEHLDEMMDSGSPQESSLAIALQGVMRAIAAVQGHGPTTNGALPESPLPWPGALRDDIDYTADDFPHRYQPPPGWCWSADGRKEKPVGYRDAVSVEAESVSSAHGCMLLDNWGRVRWVETADGDYSFGRRWTVWMSTHNGFPMAESPHGSSLPRPVAADGSVLATNPNGTTTGYPGSGNWRSTSDYEKAKAVIARNASIGKIASSNDGPTSAPEFEPPAPVSV